jgi:hypothetical protein
MEKDGVAWDGMGGDGRRREGNKAREYSGFAGGSVSTNSQVS